VPSEYVRRSLCERLGIPPDRVKVAPWGIDLNRLKPAGQARDPYLVYPARNWPHKNHARLFEAFQLLRRDRPELKLVLTGDDHPNLPDGVVSLGRVPPDELVTHYQRAAALVFPSLNEGFGFPPLEAMACGCPVAVSRRTSLPEICGDSAEYFDPTDPADIAAAVGRVLDLDTDNRIRAGLVRAQRYTWERSAQLHESVYAELLDGG
jgi:glycosyltransferase involved in cell wall biosynthesis